MWKPSSRLALLLVTTSALVTAQPASAAGPAVRLCREAGHDALTALGLRFPQRLPVASFSATVRDAPSSEGTVLRRLTGDASVEAVGLVKGSEARNTCDASPYEGCVDKSDAWLEVTLSGKTPGKGFLSFINVAAPEALSCQSVPYTELVGMRSYGAEPHETARAPGRTVFDAEGLEHFLVLPVERGTVRLTRVQLEFFVRRLPQGRIQYLAGDKPQSTLSYAEKLESDVEMQPALPAFGVVGEGLVRSDLGQLPARGPVFTWGEEEHQSMSGPVASEQVPLHQRPVVFQLPAALSAAEVVLLATPRGVRALERHLKKAKVERKEVVQGRKRAQQDVTTCQQLRVDLDGRAGADLVREDCLIDEYDTSGEEPPDPLFVRVGFGGEWLAMDWRWSH